jgi:hypothetical protein
MLKEIGDLVGIDGKSGIEIYEEVEGMVLLEEKGEKGDVFV